jgi:hypothetical protein
MEYFKGISTTFFVFMLEEIFIKNALDRRGEITSVQGNEIKMYN